MLERIAAGRTNPEIAAELFLTVPTVKSYVNQVFAKLGVRTRAEAWPASCADAASLPARPADVTTSRRQGTRRTVLVVVTRQVSSTVRPRPWCSAGPGDRDVDRHDPARPHRARVPRTSSARPAPPPRLAALPRATAHGTTRAPSDDRAPAAGTRLPQETRDDRHPEHPHPPSRPAPGRRATQPDRLRRGGRSPVRRPHRASRPVAVDGERAPRWMRVVGAVLLLGGGALTAAVLGWPGDAPEVALLLPGVVALVAGALLLLAGPASR